MIYLITGVPGSGKTLYAVAELLQKLAREKFKTEDGNEVQRRLVIDNIPRLVLPHELMAAGALKSGQVEPGEGHGLWNWHEWCKPGDVIVCDEVQRHWRPRGMGTKPPEAIAMLETHRHKGVDLVLITQNPMLLDQNVRRLVGRHLHVRRLFGTSSAIIYDWDGCNTDTSRLANATRTVWRYPKDAYKLYASSELHTKQHQKIPLFLAFPLVVLALGVFAGPKAWDALHRSTTGKSLQASGTKAVPAQAVASGAPAAVRRPASAPAAPVVEARQSRPVGCVVAQGHCSCFDSSGDAMQLEPQACEDTARRVLYVVPSMAGAADAIHRADRQGGPEAANSRAPKGRGQGDGAAGPMSTRASLVPVDEGDSLVRVVSREPTLAEAVRRPR